MCLPLVVLLLVCAHWFQSDKLVRTVKHCVTFRAPWNCVNGFCIVLDQIRSQTAISRPNFQTSVLACCGQCATVITPFNADYWLGVSIWDCFFCFAWLIVNPETAICESNSKNFTRTLCWRDPVMVSSVGVKLHELRSLRWGRVPSVNHIVITDATIIANEYLVSSLFEDHETEVQMSSCLGVFSMGLILNRIYVQVRGCF